MKEPVFRVLNGTGASPINIIKTKLAVPRLPRGVVVRPRLHYELDQSLQYSLTLIEAPAGYGKTTALVEWLRIRGFAAGWFTVDQNDGLPLRFFSYLITALDSALPGLASKVLPLLSSDYNAGLEAVLLYLIEELGNAQEDIILILDDYHLVHNEDIQQGMAYFINYMPARLHVIIATREEPFLPLPRMRVRGQIRDISIGELRFQHDEAAALFKQRDMNLAEPEILELESRTEGWAAGLNMACRARQDNMGIPNWVDSFDAGNHYLESYFEEEVFAKWPADTQRFMLQTCILHNMQGQLCDTVTGSTGGEQMLRSLAHANAFILPLDQKHSWYRYHSLWAEYLQNRLDRCPDVDPLDLHLRAAAWYKANSHWEEAIHHYLRSNDLEQALKLMEERAPVMLRNKDVNTLKEWLTELPGPMLEDSALLCLVYTWTYLLNGDVMNGLEWLSKAEKSLSGWEDGGAEADSKQILQGEIELAKAFEAILNHDLPGIIEHVFAARRLIPGKALFYKEIDTLGQPEASLLNTCLCFYGELQLCFQAITSNSYEAMRNISPGSGLLPIAKAEVLYEQNRIDEALYDLREGLAEAQQFENMQAVVPGVLTLIRVYRSRGDWKGAFRLLDEWEERMYLPRQWSWKQILLACRASLDMETGNEDAALRWIQDNGLSVMDHLSVAREYEYLVLARLLIRLGKRDDALLLLKGLKRLAEQENRLPSLIEIDTLMAIAYQKNGASEEAMIALQKALQLGERHGYVRRFADEGAAMGALIRQYTRWQPTGQMDPGIAVSYSYIRQLKEISSEMTTVSGPGRIAFPERSISPGNVYEPLTARELEVLKLLASGSSNAYIASQLGLALATVKFHTKNIFSKLMVSNRVQAVHRARELFILN